MATYRKVQTKSEIRQTVSTRSFVCSHGKSPRGDGYWSFEIAYLTFNEQSIEEVTFQGPYSSALNCVIEHVQENISQSKQVAHIEVLP